MYFFVLFFLGFLDQQKKIQKQILENTKKSSKIFENLKQFTNAPNALENSLKFRKKSKFDKNLLFKFFECCLRIKIVGTGYVRYIFKF